MNWTSKNDGFIQAQVLMGIILAVAVLSGGIYIGAKQYRDYRAKEIAKEKEAQELLGAQQRVLGDTRAEIEKLKAENEAVRQRQRELEKAVAKETATIPISASELASILTGVVHITCKDSSGSGSLWDIDSEKVVITNGHVIKTPFYSTFNKQFYCVIWVNDFSGNFESNFTIFPSTKWRWNTKTDIAVMKLTERFYPDGKPFPEELRKPVSQVNYEISNLKKCPAQITIGSPAVVIGYPAFGEQDISFLGYGGTDSARIVSNGVVSGYDKTVTGLLGPLPYQNYYVSAKIDSGSSGGIAISKTESGLCVLGIPTWLNVGNYETQGLIQNIHNVMYKQQ